MTGRTDDMLRRAAALVLALLLLPAAALRAAPDDEEASRDAQIENRSAPRMGHFNLEANVFPGSATAKAARRRCNVQLKMRIAELDRVCSLSPQQKDKLQLAGQGDIERFFDRFEELRAELEPLMKKDPQAWNHIWPKIGPLQQKFQSGLFSDRSFFGKVLGKTLSSEQQKKFEQVQLERRRFHYLASIEAALTTLEDTVALAPDQHEAAARMLAESPPPLRSGQYDTYVVMSRLRRLPKEKLIKLLDARQRTLLEGDRNLNDIDQFLVQQGYLSKEEVGNQAAAFTGWIEGDLDAEFDP